VATSRLWFKRFSWMAGAGILFTSVGWAIEGRGLSSIPWILIGLLMLVQSFRSRMPSTLRKALTAVLLIGLTAVFLWATAARYRQAQFADSLVDAYLAVVCAGLAVWVALVWAPASAADTPTPRFLMMAVPSGLIAGFATLLGLSMLSSGYVSLALLAWVTSGISVVLVVIALLIRRQVQSQQRLANRLGYEDLHAYVEARQRQGATIDVMAVETGMNADALRRAHNAWEAFRRLRGRAPVNN